MAIHGYGWRKQQPDKRDLRFLPKGVPLPPSVDLRPLCPSIYDQGQHGSCTSMAACGAFEFDLLKQGILDFMPSRMFEYYNTRVLDGDVDTDGGGTIRNANKALAKNGVCIESLWPYTDKDLLTKPPASVYTAALPDAITNYAAVLQDLYSMKLVLANGLPIQIGFTVYDSFEGGTTAQDGIIPMPDVTREGILGGHAVLCLTGDTQIPLLSGETVTIRELADNQREAWLYSCDSQGNIVPGYAHSARKTGVNRRVVRIILDNGQKITCTPDHLIMMRDGTYRNAGDLQVNDSLMPCYTRLSNQEGMVGYEQVYNPATKKWRYTHRAVARPYNSDVIHHKDFNKRNNDPSNLQPMTWEAHTKLHTEQTQLLQGYAKSEQGRQKSRELMQNLWADPVWREQSMKRLSENGKKVSTKLAEEGKCGFQAQDREKHRERARQTGLANYAHMHTPEAGRKRGETMKKRFAEDEEYRLMRLENARKNLSQHNAEVAIGKKALTEAQRNARVTNAKNNFSDAEKQRTAQLKTTWKRFYQDTYPTFDDYLSATKDNHKVIAVEDAGMSDVYDLTVDGHHNFAVSAGVFVHNCVGFANSIMWSGKSLSNVFICRNSWGTSWGNVGYFVIPYAYFTDPNLSSDLWVINAVPGSIIPTPPTPVPIEDCTQQFLDNIAAGMTPMKSLSQFFTCAYGGAGNVPAKLHKLKCK